MDRVQALNREYRAIAEGAGADYLDVWPALADDEGGLRRAFTSDFLHLNGLGYAAWADVLRPHLTS